MSGQPASLQDILSSLNDLTTEVRRLSRDVASLHVLLEDRLGPLPALLLLHRARGSLPSPLPVLLPSLGPAVRPFLGLLLLVHPFLGVHPAVRPFLGLLWTVRPFLGHLPFRRVSSLSASSCAPVPRAPAPAFSSPASSGSEPAFHSPTAAAASGTGFGSPASSGLAVEPSSTPPCLPPSAQISERTRREIAVSIGSFFHRALGGEHRGNSGRRRNLLASRLYVVCRNAAGETFDPPLLFYSFSAAERLVKVNGHLGDAVFCGFPALWEARLACAEAGLQPPVPANV